MSDISYTVSQSFIQAGIIGIMFLILPYFGFLVGLSVITGTMILFMLVFAKVLSFIILRFFFGMKAGGGRDIWSMLLSAFLVLVVLWMLGLAKFDLIGFLTLLVVFLAADVLGHMLLISSRASRRN